MAHFAEIVNGKVVRVIVAEQDFINTLPGYWVQTSYNTKLGVHYDNHGNPDGGIALRKNYAGIGFTYDNTRDAFIPPRPYNSWYLNEDTCQWEAPIPCPNDENKYTWDEIGGQWVIKE